MRFCLIFFHGIWGIETIREQYCWQFVFWCVLVDLAREFEQDEENRDLVIQFQSLF
jgi:hypothetical protein